MSYRGNCGVNQAMECAGRANAATALWIYLSQANRSGVALRLPLHSKLV
jgi:hypothetical protein